MTRYSTVIEADAESALKDGVRSLKGLCLKIRFLGMAGAPDRLVLLPWGRFYFVELKRMGGKLEVSQTIMFPKLAKRGFPVEILYGVEQVQAWLTKISPPTI